MKQLMFLLILACILGIASAFTGVQSFYWTSHNGTVVSSLTYWHGYWRFLPLVPAALFAVMFYAVYRRSPLAWTLGWIAILIGAAVFIAEAWLGLIYQPKGEVGALAATVGGIVVAIYWGVRWYKQKSYFIPDDDEQT